jgi:LEA14-like dessication related protein
MKLEKKHYIAGAIALVTITGAALYLQYKKLMNYCISIKNVKINSLSLSKADFNLFLNFKNNSDLKIDIVSQDYTAYLNDKEIAQVSNPKAQIISPKSISEIGVNIVFNPSKLLGTVGALAQNFAFSPEKVILKVKCKLKVKLYIFTFNIPYEYVTSVKDLMSNKSENKSTSNEKKC